MTFLQIESSEGMRRTNEAAIHSGYQRRTRELADWARKKNRRYIRREELLAYLAGNKIGASAGGGGGGLNQNQHHHHHHHHQAIVGGKSLPAAVVVAAAVHHSSSNHHLHPHHPMTLPKSTNDAGAVGGVGGGIGLTSGFTQFNGPSNDHTELHTFKEALARRQRLVCVLF